MQLWPVQLCKEWPGEVTIVNGRPRNSKCQGLVEQGNGTMEKMLVFVSFNLTQILLLGQNGSP